jgi:tRNA nucleotidyltransferase/poly(A) polymerase
MKINLNQNKNLKLFKIISEAAERNNQSVYIVGGYVRDLLMKRKASTDIDFVTEQSGIELAQNVAQDIDPKLKVSVFKTYGTAMIKYKDLELEFVGARKKAMKTAENLKWKEAALKMTRREEILPLMQWPFL